MEYINIHTHHSKSSGHEIQNLSSGFGSVDAKSFYSMGIHPWYLKSESAEMDFLSLSETATMLNVLAIGECGLDKLCETKWGLQETYFSKQIQLANDLQKPLIIHCVRAYEEVFASLKSNKNKVPVIFHGFNKNLKLAERILQQGYYLSFGKHLYNDPVQNVFKQIPLEKLFLETDNDEIEIKDIYTQAAKIRQIELPILIEALKRNAMLIFGENFITA